MADDLDTITWADVRAGLDRIADTIGEWQGVPVPLTDLPVRLHDRHPLREFFASGTAVAFDCAMGAIASADPSLAAEAVELGRRTRAVIRQNLAWAFGYNAILLPIAAGALWPFGKTLLSPALAGAAMSISSVTVMLNSLRLLGWRPRRSP